MKIFRDPVHNVIDLDSGCKNANELLIKLIDSKEFQRLRRIKQLGFAEFSYPNATHTRFAHSLGVAFLMKRFLDKIISIEARTMDYCRRFEELSKHKDKLIDFFKQINKDKPHAIVAALLHDVGHGVLSHVTESVTNIKHEDWTRAIILGNTDINKFLKEYDANYPEKIYDILSSAGNHLSVSRIIDGTIDVDKMDYLLRDSHMTGSGYGKFDIEWLLNVLTVGIKNEQVVIGFDEGKGLSVAEDFVMARIYMLENVYLHKVAIVAQKMLALLFQRINELSQKGTVCPFPTKSMERIFINHASNADEMLLDYLSISDEHLLFLLHSLQTSNDYALRRLSGGLYNRTLFKEIHSNHWNGFDAYIKDTMGVEAKYYGFEVKVDSAKEKLIYRAGKDEIYLFGKDGSGNELLNKTLMVSRITYINPNPVRYYVDDEIYQQYLSSI
ncbi:MAG: HD domain-containing protein [Defluviitaleaceae bacterium]|nr:HD domain-containing protein [Defluviitaleaceae bacterium]